jgi:hypothetical protein
VLIITDTIVSPLINLATFWIYVTHDNKLRIKSKKFCNGEVVYLLSTDLLLFCTAGKPVTQESSLDVFCHVIFDVNIDVMDVGGRPQEFVA